MLRMVIGLGGRQRDSSHRQPAWRYTNVDWWPDVGWRNRQVRWSMKPPMCPNNRIDARRLVRWQLLSLTWTSA